MDILQNHALDVLLILAMVGLIAGFIDAISGGGGLIVIPALLIQGFDPLSALMINKLQCVFGSGMSSLSYYRRGMITQKWIIPACATAFFGSLGGTYALFFIAPDFLLLFIPLLLIIIALYFAFSSRSDTLARPQKISLKAYTYGFIPFIGFYDGFFGPGTGSFLTLLNHAGIGQTLKSAIAHAKPTNFATNIAALIVFALNGEIMLVVGLTMGVGQLLGAYMGSAVVSKRGAQIARPLLVIVSLILAIKLIYDNWLY